MLTGEVCCFIQQSHQQWIDNIRTLIVGAVAQPFENLEAFDAWKVEPSSGFVPVFPGIKLTMEHRHRRVQIS